MCPTNLLTFQAFIHEHSRDYCYIIEHILAEKQSDFLTCKLGSSKYMSNSVYKFRYPDANMSAPTCVRKYYRSETDVKTQYLQRFDKYFRWADSTYEREPWWHFWPVPLDWPWIGFCKWSLLPR